MFSDKKYKTSDTDPQIIDFIDPKHFYVPNSGLGMTSLPGRNKKIHRRNLTDDLSRINHIYQADVIVTLVRDNELAQCGLKDYFGQIHDLGMESYHFPIKDKWLPDTALMIKCVDFILLRLSENKRVVVHCNGGKGRAATICAGVLMIGEKYSSSDAISVVKLTRSGTMRNPLQILFLRSFREKYDQLKKKY
jgi:hypothetical protein